MRPRTTIALNLTGTVVFVSVFYWFGRDHSLLMLLRWAMLFVATLLLPMYLSEKAEAELARLPTPVSPGLRRATAYPVWIGLFALAAAIALIARPR